MVIGFPKSIAGTLFGLNIIPLTPGPVNVPPGVVGERLITPSLLQYSLASVTKDASAPPGETFTLCELVLVHPSTVT